MLLIISFALPSLNTVAVVFLAFCGSLFISLHTQVSLYT